MSVLRRWVPGCVALPAVIVVSTGKNVPVRVEASTSFVQKTVREVDGKNTRKSMVAGSFRNDLC